MPLEVLPAAKCRHRPSPSDTHHTHHITSHHITHIHHAELGIDIGAILRSTKAILLHQMRSPALDALDFGGALVFLLALGGLHLLVSWQGAWYSSMLAFSQQQLRMRFRSLCSRHICT